MMLFEQFHIGNCRSESKSVFQLSPFRSPILLIGTIIALLIHVLMMYLPAGNLILSLETVDLETWSLLLSLSLSVLVVMELYKLIKSLTFKTF